jgi:uncharacterized membrane protein
MSQSTIQRVSATRDIEAGVEEVWKVVSDLDREPAIWKNIREVRVISMEGNRLEREANVGPRAFSQKSHQTLVFDPNKSIFLTIKAEALEGDRSLTLTPLATGGTRVDIVWSLQTKGVPGFVGGIVKGQIAKATDDALSNIAREAEASGNGEGRGN